MMSMEREVLKNAAIYGVAGILSKAIGFFMLPFYAHMLGTHGYGVIGMFDSACSLLLSIFGYGITGSVIRIYHEEEKQNKRCVVTTGVLLLMLVSAPVIGGLIIIREHLSSMLFGGPQYSWLALFGLAAFGVDLYGLTASQSLIVNQRSVVFSIINLSRLIVAVPVYVFFVKRYGVEGYFLGTFLLAVIGSTAFNYFCFTGVGLKFDWLIAKQIVKFEGPLIPGHIFVFISRQIERVFVRYMISLESVGILEMGYKFAPLLNIFIFEPFMLSWHTKRTEIAEQKNGKERIGKMFTSFLFLLIFGAIILIVTVKDIIELLTPPEFWMSYRIAKIEIITTVLSACYYHAYFGLYFMRRTGYISLIRIVTSSFKLLFSFYLIKAYGIMGAAYSACAFMCIQVLWAFIAGQRSYTIRYEYKKIFLLICFGYIITYLLDDGVVGGNIKSQIQNWESPSNWVICLEGTLIGKMMSAKMIAVLTEKLSLVLVIIMKISLCLPFLILGVAIKATETNGGWLGRGLMIVGMIKRVVLVRR